MLGKVFLGDAEGVADGELRIEITGGGDGSGTVDVVVLSSDTGPALYEVVDDDGNVDTDVLEAVHAGDEEIYLVFTYKPIETIANGELRFTPPSDWDPPQADSSSQHGYTRVEGGGIGSAEFLSQLCDGADLLPRNGR